MQIKPAITLTEVKPCQSQGMVEGVWWCGDILISKAKGTLSGCILSWIYEINWLLKIKNLPDSMGI